MPGSISANFAGSRTDQDFNGEQREFRHYSARGAGLDVALDDGTLAPTAAVASIAFVSGVVVWNLYRGQR